MRGPPRVEEEARQAAMARFKSLKSRSSPWYLPFVGDARVQCLTGRPRASCASSSSFVLSRSPHNVIADSWALLEIETSSETLIVVMLDEPIPYAFTIFDSNRYIFIKAAALPPRLERK